MANIVRCFAERKDGQWQAFSVEFGLAVQGDSFQDVRQKLHEQLEDYVREAHTIDAEFKEQLLARCAPLSVRVKYHFAAAMLWLRQASLPSRRQVFSERVPHRFVAC